MDVVAKDGDSVEANKQKDTQPKMALEDAKLAKEVQIVNTIVKDDTFRNPEEHDATKTTLMASLGAARIRDKVISCLEYHLSPTTKRLGMLTCKSEFKPSSWASHVEYWMSMFRWYFSLLDKYDWIVMNVPDVMNDLETSRRTDEAHMGFPIYSTVRTLDKQDFNLVWASVNAHINETRDILSRLDSVVVAGLRGEMNLQNFFSELNFNSNIHDVLTVWRFFRELDNNKSVINPLPNNYQPHYDKFWLPVITTSHIELTDYNLPFRDYVFDHINSIVKTHTKLEFDSAQTIFTRLLETFQKSMTRMDSIDTVAANSVKFNPNAAFTKLVTTFLMARWYEVDYESFDPTILNLHILTDCFFSPIWLKQCMISLPTQTQIHNAIALMFIRKFPGYKPIANEPPVRHTTTDLLLLELNRGSVPAGLRDKMLDYFFGGLQPGEGWAGAGFSHLYRIPNNTPQFHHGRFIYESWFGRPLRVNNQLANPQVVKFKAMTMAMLDETQKWARNKDRQNLQTLCVFLDEQATRLMAQSESYDAVEEFCRVVSYSSLLNPISDKDILTNPLYQMPLIKPTVEDVTAIGESKAYDIMTELNMASRVRRAKVEFRVGEITSLVLLTKFDTLSFWPNSHNIIIDGWSRTLAIQEFVDAYAIVRRELPSQLMKKAEKIDFAFTISKSPLNSILRQKIGMDGVRTMIVPITGCQRIFQKIDAIKNFVSDKKVFFGIVDEVYYRPNFDKNNAQLKKFFGLHSIAVAETPIHNYNYAQLVTAVQDDSLYRWVELAIDNRKPIIIKIPAPVVLTEPSPEVYKQEVYTLNDTKISISPLKVMTRWADDPHRWISKELWLLNPPLYSTPQLPFILFEPSQLPSLMMKLEFRKHYKYFNDFTRSLIDDMHVTSNA